MKATVREALLTGTCASLLSATALAVFGKIENRSPYAPINAVSHWFLGRKSLREVRPTVRHTLLGYLIHHAMSIFWATVYAAGANNYPAAKKPVGAIAGGMVTAAAACYADFHLTPSRLTPGFEHRLSKPALTGVYMAFGLGIALGYLILSKRSAE